MFLKRVFPVILSAIFVIASILPSVAYSCGHDGFYVGLGYNQMFSFTNENKLTGGGNLGKVKIGPGMGGFAVFGYDFCGSRWGIQMPVEFTRQKLNDQEWTSQFGSTLEGVLHLVEWQNGIDLHLLGGVGWSYLTEGHVQDQTASTGITVDLGPGMSYYFVRNEKISSAVSLDVPVRMVNYFGNTLSANGTMVFVVPIRLSIQVGF